MGSCTIENCVEVSDMKRTMCGQDGTGGLVACTKKLNMAIKYVSAQIL